MHRIDLCLSRGVGIGNDTAPEVDAIKCGKVKASDNTEIVATAFQGLPQVDVVFCIGLNDLARSKDNLFVVS